MRPVRREGAEGRGGGGNRLCLYLGVLSDRLGPRWFGSVSSTLGVYTLTVFPLPNEKQPSKSQRYQVVSTSYETNMFSCVMSEVRKVARLLIINIKRTYYRLW